MQGRIMVIDETLDTLEVYLDLLSGQGYEAVWYPFAAPDPADVELVDPELIILDCRFDEEQRGRQLSHLLRTGRARASIPIILCAVPSQRLQAAANSLRADGVRLVFKPFEPDTLLGTIRQALELQDTPVPFSEAVTETRPLAGG